MEVEMFIDSNKEKSAKLNGLVEKEQLLKEGFVAHSKSKDILWKAEVGYVAVYIKVDSTNLYKRITTYPAEINFSSIS